MEISEAVEIIEACAEADYDGSPSFETSPEMQREILGKWVINATVDDVKGAIATLGGVEAARIHYVREWDACHAAEYDLDGDE
jgi:hypothetical protein